VCVCVCVCVCGCVLVIYIYIYIILYYIILYIIYYIYYKVPPTPGGQWTSDLSELSSSCTASNISKYLYLYTGTSDPWWTVDLGSGRDIEFVHVFNRGDCCWERLKGFQVILSNTSEWVLPDIHSPKVCVCACV
jgi:hypothetical protein